MKIPEIVRNIGAADGKSRVYIEDYVHSYLNGLRSKKDILPLRAALFGRVAQKENERCYFVYGACCVVEELEYGRNEEQVRKEFFEDYELIGYVNLVKKHPAVPDKDKGYYIFYESNEAMQNYLSFCYERERKKDKLREEDLYFGTFAAFQSEKKGRFAGELAKQIAALIGVIILATAVCSINSYDKMYGFAAMAKEAARMQNAEE